MFTSGTMAGTSLSDLIFIVGFAVIIRKVETRLMAENLHESVPVYDAVSFFGKEDDDVPMVVTLLNPAYVDDYTVIFYCMAADLLSKAAAVMRILWHTFREYKLELNMKIGKTAIMFQP